MATILENVGNFLNNTKNKTKQFVDNGVQNIKRSSPNDYNIFAQMPRLGENALNTLQNNPLSRGARDLLVPHVNKPLVRDVALPAATGAVGFGAGILSLGSPAFGKTYKEQVQATTDHAQRFKVPSQVPLVGGSSVPSMAANLVADPTNYIPIGKAVKGASVFKRVAPNIAVNAAQGFVQPAESNQERLLNTGASAALGLAIPAAVAGTKSFVKSSKETLQNLTTDTYRAARNDIIKNAATNPNYRPFRNMFDALEKVPQLRQVAESPAMMSDIRSGNQVIDFVRQQLPKLKVDSEAEARKIVRYVSDLYDGKTPREVPPALKAFDKSLKTAGGRFVGQAGSIKLGGFDESNIDTQPLLKEGQIKAQSLPTELPRTQQTLQAPQQSQGSNQNGSLPDNTKPVLNPEDPFYNVNRIGVENPVKQQVSDLIQSPEVKPQIEQTVGDPLTFKEIQSKAQVSPELNKTYSRAETEKLGAEALALRNKVAELADMGLNSEQYKEALIKDKAFGQYIARLLGQRRIISDPSQKTIFNEMVSKILKEGADPDEVANAAKNIDFNDAKQSAEFYRKFIKATPSDWLDVIRYNSMLSSPNTFINNASSNALASSVIPPIEKTLTGAIDFLGSKLFKKQQTQFAGEGAAYAKGYAQSLSNASSKFIDSIRGKSLDTNLDTRSIPLYTQGRRAKVESVLRTPTKLLEATDQFFTELVTGGERSALKYRQGKGVNISDSVIESQSKSNAAYRLFRSELNDPRQGGLLNGIDKVTGLIQQARSSNNPYLSNIAKYTLPFVRTPMNILKQGVEYSPFGVATLHGAANKSEQLSKIVIGTSAAAMTAMLTTSGRTTWAAPSSKKEKDEFYAAGMQPYSVKIGDKWVAYSKLPPQLSFPIALVSALHDSEKSGKITDSDTDNILNAVAKTGNFFADQSYLKSIGDLLGSIRGDYGSNLSSVASNYAQQLVPFRALGGWLARLDDPYQRQVNRDAPFWEQQVQMLMQNIPGASRNLDPRLDAKGEPLKAQNKELNAFSPFRVSTEDPENKAIYDTNQTIKKLNKNLEEIVTQAEKGEDVEGLFDKLVPEAGAATEEEFNQAITDQAFKKTLMNSAKKIFASPLSESKKQEAVKRLGLDYEDVKNESIRALNDNDQAKLLAPQLSESSEEQIDKWIKAEVLTPNVISKMLKQELITEAQAKALKDKINPPKEKKSIGRSSGGVTKAKRIAGLKKLASIKLPKPKRISLRRPSASAVTFKAPELRANVEKIAFKKVKSK